MIYVSFRVAGVSGALRYGVSIMTFRFDFSGGNLEVSMASLQLGTKFED